MPVHGLDLRREKRKLYISVARRDWLSIDRGNRRRMAEVSEPAEGRKRGGNTREGVGSTVEAEGGVEWVEAEAEGLRQKSRQG
jgi:hypothetical protein